MHACLHQQTAWRWDMQRACLKHIHAFFMHRTSSSKPPLHSHHLSSQSPLHSHHLSSQTPWHQSCNRMQNKSPCLPPSAWTARRSWARAPSSLKRYSGTSFPLTTHLTILHTHNQACHLLLSPSSSQWLRNHTLSWPHPAVFPPSLTVSPLLLIPSLLLIPWPWSHPSPLLHLALTPCPAQLYPLPSLSLQWRLPLNSPALHRSTSLQAFKPRTGYRSVLQGGIKHVTGVMTDFQWCPVWAVVKSNWIYLLFSL